MRIIAGKLKGRRLKSFKGHAIRPTPDRARESLFNIIGDSIIESSFLDLFAGTGAVGIEALSRGASEAVFIESSPSACKLISANTEICGLNIRAHDVESSSIFLIKKEVVPGIRDLERQKKSFDFIFLDPPYREGLYQPVLSLIWKSSILKPDSWTIAEHDSKERLELPEIGLKPFRVARSGDTSFSLFRKETE
ncbi:MAG: 16S rRNA (guanine(966)-N(2))-methyltransferase RsmD [Nitrospinae bacterium]|nr:16S rRNA (guanine(966)-N(2))-methyltransferase RsmD [Nitrospinota bacterium]